MALNQEEIAKGQGKRNDNGGQDEDGQRMVDHEYIGGDTLTILKNDIWVGNVALVCTEGVDVEGGEGTNVGEEEPCGPDIVVTSLSCVLSRGVVLREKRCLLLFFMGVTWGLGSSDSTVVGSLHCDSVVVVSCLRVMK